MKKTLFGAAAAIAIVAPMGAAHADATGHIDLSYQASNTDFNPGSSYDSNALNIAGAVIMPMAGWDLQLDASHEDYNYDHSDYDNALTTFDAHAIWRNDAYAFGGYVGLGGVYGQTLYMGGLEGQYYTSNMTFDGALTYAATSDGYNYDLWNARVGGSYFINPNFDINASISYTDWDHYSDTVTGYGIGAAYRFSGSRFSVSGNYTRENWDYGSSDADSDVFKFGLSYAFGTDSLQEESQRGASFNNAAPLVDVFSRWD